MKAAVLNDFGLPLDIQTLPDPVIGAGEIIVDVAAAAVAGHAAGVLSEARSYMPETSIAPAPLAGARDRARRHQGQAG